MANAEQLILVKQGVESWNRWREQNNNVKPDLSESDLRQANLHKANLSHANLNKAKLQFSNLTGANLKGATGLSSSQIDLAITDKQTKLPDYLEEEMDDDFLLQM